MGQFIAISIGVFLSLIILVVIVLLVAKKYLSPSGNVNIEINGDRTISVAQGNSLMSTLNENGVFLPSACGGKASCGQCKVQVLEGGGEILDSEKPHFSRKEIKAGWRLGCQCKVKGDLKIHVDESILGVKEYECTVISNKNVATFIKEFKVQLPAGAVHQGVQGAAACRSPHGLPAWLLRPDQDTCIRLHRLRQGFRQVAHWRRVSAQLGEVRTLPTQV